MCVYKMKEPSVFGHVMFYKFSQTTRKKWCFMRAMQNFKDNCKASHKTHHPNDVLTSCVSIRESGVRGEKRTHIFSGCSMLRICLNMNFYPYFQVKPFIVRESVRPFHDFSKYIYLVTCVGAVFAECTKIEPTMLKLRDATKRTYIAQHHM